MAKKDRNLINIPELMVEYEAERTAFLERLGIQIVRFENKVVHQNIEAVR